MASNGAAPNAEKLQVLKDALYHEVTQHGSTERAFKQQDLMDLNMIPGNDLGLLLSVVQSLCDDKLFVAMNIHGELAWRYRTREDARKYTSLPSLECQLVYGIIDEAGADGIWNRTIKNRLNMHENTVKNCIKILESKGHITALKNVEHPNKKMYIKSTLRPSERATGGPWFTDGELDLAFIKHLEMAVFAYIRKHSAYDLKEASKRGGGGADSARAAAKVPKKGVIKGVAPGTTTMDSETSLSRGTKRAATEISNDPDNDTNTTAAKGTTTKPKCREDLLPHPAGYKWYPTVTEVAKVIHDTNISSTPLSEADVQQLIDVLCFDGFIEPVKVNGRLGYRVVRPTKQDNATFEKRRDDYRNGIGLDLPVSGVKPIGNGLTEAPCGRCPVFNLCEEGGPVSPNNCVYFLQWLGLDDGAAKPKAEVAAAK